MALLKSHSSYSTLTLTMCHPLPCINYMTIEKDTSAFLSFLHMKWQDGIAPRQNISYIMSLQSKLSFGHMYCTVTIIWICMAVFLILGQSKGFTDQLLLAWISSNLDLGQD